MGTTADRDTATVRVPDTWLWAVRIAGAVLGAGAGFGVAPLVGLLLDLIGDAPGTLRLVATLPTVWAVLVLTLVGAVAGAWVAVAWRRDSPVVTVDAGQVRLRRAGSAVRLGRDEIGAVLTDRHDLVLLDVDGVDLARVPAGDLPGGQLATVFERFGYPWRGTTDRRAFTLWEDRDPDLDEPVNALLRARERALVDKRHGAAQEALDALRAAGVSVRDRHGVQEYHRTRR